MEFKPFRVDFKYMVEDQASIFVIAETADAAKAGAMAILEQEGQYTGIQITNAEVHKKQKPETLQ